MGEEMKIEKDIAEAIDLFLDDEVHVMKRGLERGKSVLVAQHYGQDWTKFELGQYEALNKISTFDLMKCLVNGYEVV